MNIYDVSKKAGVSIATVSRVMNGTYPVSEKTRTRVMDAVKELEYTPNVFARGLGINSMKAIGILCSDCSDSFLASAVYYLEKSLRKNGYDSFLCCTGYQLSTKQNDLSLLMSKRVDALILVGSNFIEPKDSDNTYILKASSHIPVMIMNGYLAGENIYCTLCDDYNSAVQAANHLIHTGFRKPIFLHGSKTYSTQQKLHGFHDALQSAGIAVSESMYLECPKDIHRTSQLLLDRKNQGVFFDCALCCEDIFGVGAIKYAKKIGLKIPQEFSIIAYNNLVLSICCDPELSTIDNHVAQLSLTTVNSLMDVLAGKTLPNQLRISNELILRYTTLGSANNTNHL